MTAGDVTCLHLCHVEQEAQRIVSVPSGEHRKFGNCAADKGCRFARPSIARRGIWLIVAAFHAVPMHYNPRLKRSGPSLKNSIINVHTQYVHNFKLNITPTAIVWQPYSPDVHLTGWGNLPMYRAKQPP